MPSSNSIQRDALNTDTAPSPTQHKPTLRVIKILEAVAASNGLTLSQIAARLECPKAP